MKKRMVKLVVSGFLDGVAIGFIISLIFSICIGDGSYYSVSPGLIETAGNELNAVILQTVLCGMIGAVFSVASIIWEIDAWSLARQTGVYFMIVSAAMFPIAYYANWMRHSISGVLIYIGIFALIFALVWIVQYSLWKHRIKRMNDLVKKSNQRG